MKKFLLLILVLSTFAILIAEDLKLDIMFTNDVHGGIDRYPATFMNPSFPPMLGGGGSAATYIKRVRSLSDGVKRDNLLIDAGDFFQGHPIGTVSNGKSIIEYMNMIGYEVLVIGNHEFDIKPDQLKPALDMAKFPILSCNIVKKGTNELADYVAPYVILEKMGIKLGIIGVTTTDTKYMSFPENVKDIDFLNAKDALNKWIPEVKKQSDILIVVGHMGLPYEPEPAYERRYGKDAQPEEQRWGYDAQQIAHEVEGIDLLFGGHMHKGFKEPWEDPNTHTLVMQGYAMGSNIGHVTIKIDKETKTISGWEKPAVQEGILVTLFEDELIPDEKIGNRILEMQAKAEKGMNEIIGEAAIDLSREGSGAQNLIGNLVVEAMKDAVDADFAFINLGGIRSDIPAGPITLREVFDVMPFDNQLVVLKVDGRMLKKIIEARVRGGRHGMRVAGVKVVYSKKREDWDRVTDLTIGGEEWKADKIYHIATTDFLLQGNAGLELLTELPENQIIRYEKSLRDAIADYIRANSPVSAKIDDRWIRDDNSKPSEALLRELNK